MSPATNPRPRTGRKKKKKKTLPMLLYFFWPLLLGILVTPFAVRSASIFAMSGPSALRVLYPYVILVQGHAQTFATSQEETLAQWVMYGQFPIYGLLWMLGRRFIRGAGGLITVVLVHCIGLGTAIVTTPSFG